MKMARSFVITVSNARKDFRLTYNTWKSMRHRCANPNASDYKYYGGKGIQVCERWDNFAHFLCDMGARPNKKFTLDRIDTSKGYSKANCRWATQSQQLRNYAKNVWVDVEGSKLCLKDACAHYGIKYNTYWARRKRGWSLEEALIVPVGMR